jgi:hypothetical protein
MGNKVAEMCIWWNSFYYVGIPPMQWASGDNVIYVGFVLGWQINKQSSLMFEMFTYACCWSVIVKER